MTEQEDPPPTIKKTFTTTMNAAHTLNAHNIHSSLQSLSDLIDATQKNFEVTADLLEIMSPAHKKFQEASTLSWNALKQHFVHSDKTSFEELDTISTIIHKISCSLAQLNSLESKLCNPILKASTQKNKNTLGDQPNEPSPTSPLPDPLEIAFKAKEQVDKLMDRVRPDHSSAQEVITSCCRNLCTHLSAPLPPPLPLLGRYSSILSKLTQAYCQFKTFEVKLYEPIFQYSVA